MRNHPPRILVLATFFTALASATAIVPVASPAMAKPSAATFDAEFQSIRQEMKDLWLEMHNFKPLPKYCRPPLEPMKIPHNSVMQMFGARTQALMARFRANKQSLQDFLAGNHELEKELMLNGVSPRERNYWRDNKYQLEAERLQKKFNQRDAELKAKPERNCAPAAPTKTEIEVIGGNQPPVQPPPPPPPPPPVDPLKGLTRPPFKAINIPPLSKHYCSQQEMNAVLALIPPEIAKAKTEIEANEAYIAQLRTRRAELEQRKVESHWLTSMDYEIHQTEILIADRQRTIEVIETTRRLIQSTPIVDCSNEGKEVGWIPGGWTLGTEVAIGELTIPDKPYLSTEVGGDLRLGVVALDRTDTIASVGLNGAYAFGSSGPKIGNPTRQRWLVSAELGTLRYGIRADAPDIVTTTEGVGIPGTGDLTSMFPAGVFFANPAFNDVEGIDYRHHGEWQGVRLGIDQRSEYDCGAVTLGAGLSFADLDTTDVLTGSIPGFLTDFRYSTDVDTRKVGLFVKGAVEVPVDRLWNSAVRYAGEFSGIRIRSNVEVGVNFLDAEGHDRLDLTGFVSDAQAVRVGKDDTTFGYKIGAAIAYAPPGTKGLDLSLGVEYGESDTHPVAHRSGQTGDATQIEFEQQDIFFGTLRSTFRF